MYFCIDMKSFFASVECSLRNLNSLTTPLVVVDESRGNGAIILAVSPYLKTLGIPSRCRLYEIPEYIYYIKAKPRMRKYMEYTAAIHEIFLKYVDQQDIFTYSVDEAFLDVSQYIAYHNCSYKVLATKIMNDINDLLGIRAVCGAGDNLFLAKVSLDLYAKKNKEYYHYLSLDEFIDKTWYHSNLEDIWQIGRGINRRLNKLGIYNLKDLALTDIEILKKEFGVIGLDLYEHAWGRDDTQISDVHAYKPKSKSMSRNQVLFRDYSKNEAWVPLCEMLYLLSMDLVKENLVCGCLSFGIRYSDDSGFNKSYSLGCFSNDYFMFKSIIKNMYEKYILDKEIRVIFLTFSKLNVNKGMMTLFDVPNEKYDNFSDAILKVWDKYGKNKLVIGTALTEESTLYKRNSCIGGHNSE